MVYIISLWPAQKEPTFLLYFIVFYFITTDLVKLFFFKKKLCYVTISNRRFGYEFYAQGTHSDFFFYNALAASCRLSLLNKSLYLRWFVIVNLS